MVIILYQLFFLTIIIGSSFVGLPTFISVVIMSLLFTIVNIFAPWLLVIQLCVIFLSAIIGFPIASSVSLKSTSMYKEYQKYSNQGLEFTDIVKISIKNILTQFKLINFIKSITYIILNLILYIINYRILYYNLPALKSYFGILANILPIVTSYYFFWKVPCKAYNKICINSKIVLICIFIFTYILYKNIFRIILFLGINYFLK